MTGRRAVAGAALAALLLCLVGIHWGLPARFHPDEKADVVAWMVREGRLHPDSYVNPSLPLNATAPLVVLQAAAAPRLRPGNPWSDPLLLARVLSAFLTAAAVLLAGATSPRAAPGTGALAALLLALAPGVVNFGHFATPEAWVLAAAALVLWSATRHAEDLAPAWAPGVALGLAASTTYTAAALAVPVLAAVWLRPRPPCGSADRRWWIAAALLLLAAGAVLAAAPGEALGASLRLPDARLLHADSARGFVRGLAFASLGAGAAGLALVMLSVWPRTAAHAGRLVRREVVIAGLTAAGAFLLGTPGALATPRAFLSDLAFNAQTRHEYKGLVGDSTSFLPYLRLSADALTAPVLAAATAGLLLTFARARRSRGSSLVVALGMLAPYLLVASSGHRAMRFIVPALPAAAWLAADALVRVPGARARRWLAGAVVLRSAVAAVLVVRLFLVDSRLRAERWLEAHVPAGSTIDVIANHEGYLPRIPAGRTARTVRTLSREMAPAERFEAAARAYPAEAAAWVVTTGAFYDRFIDNPSQMPERTRFFRALLEGRGGFDVVARFRQQGWLRPPAEFLDPEIVILRRSAARPSG